jgi:hypothetical protein
MKQDISQLQLYTVALLCGIKLRITGVIVENVKSIVAHFATSSASTEAVEKIALVCKKRNSKK